MFNNQTSSKEKDMHFIIGILMAIALPNLWTASLLLLFGGLKSRRPIFIRKQPFVWQLIIIFLYALHIGLMYKYFHADSQFASESAGQGMFSMLVAIQFVLVFLHIMRLAAGYNEFSMRVTNFRQYLNENPIDIDEANATLREQFPTLYRSQDGLEGIAKWMALHLENGQEDYIHMIRREV